jgi:hypothetical protein
MELWAGFVQNSFLRIEIGQICPANVQKLKGIEGKYVLQQFKNPKR